MFRLLGGIVGMAMGSVFGLIGMVLGAVLGSSFAGSIQTAIFGTGKSSQDRERAEEAYRKFYEQFYQNTNKRSYSGYTNQYGNGYTGFQNPGASETCYNNLGCSRDDSADVIKKNYRKLVSTYHPDRMAAKGLSQAEMEQAEAKFKIIQDSYDQIKKEKGI